MFKDPKGISIGTIDFDIPKVYDETSIFHSLVGRVEPPAFVYIRQCNEANKKQYISFD